MGTIYHQRIAKQRLNLVKFILEQSRGIVEPDDMVKYVYEKIKPPSRSGEPAERQVAEEGAGQKEAAGKSPAEEPWHAEYLTLLETTCVATTWVRPAMRQLRHCNRGTLRLGTTSTSGAMRVAKA